MTTRYIVAGVFRPEARRVVYASTAAEAAEQWAMQTGETGSVIVRTTPTAPPVMMSVTGKPEMVYSASRAK